MHAKYEDSISYGSKDIAKVKVDNRQTDRQTNKQTDKQTDREDKNNMPPIIRSGGIKKYCQKLKRDVPNVPKQAEAKRDGVINPLNYNFNQF